MTARPPATVMTVLGPVDPGQLGFTLAHEHILLHHTAPHLVLDDLDTAVEEVARFKAAGGGTIVEMTNQGLRRNPAGLRQVAERTGVRIIMGSGYYKAQWHPADMDTKSVESIAAEIVADLTVGVDGTGIRAGVIGEVGVSTLTPNEAKALRASARAQRQTGAAINLHFDIGVPEALRQRGLDLLEADGADLNRVATSHFRLIPEERELQLRMAARGSYIEFDLFGQERLFTAEVPGYEKESRALRVLIDRGCLERILFSSDICYRQTLVRCGGWGYAHLLANVLPRLRRHGITEAETHAVTVANPARLLAVQWP